MAPLDAVTCSLDEDSSSGLIIARLNAIEALMHRLLIPLRQGVPTTEGLVLEAEWNLQAHVFFDVLCGFLQQVVIDKFPVLLGVVNHDTIKAQSMGHPYQGGNFQSKQT